MTTEANLIRERLRPRIIETGETGRLDLRLPVIFEANLAPPRVRGFPSPFALAVTGLGIRASTWNDTVHLPRRPVRD